MDNELYNVKPIVMDKFLLKDFKKIVKNLSYSKNAKRILEDIFYGNKLIKMVRDNIFGYYRLIIEEIEKKNQLIRKITTYDSLKENKKLLIRVYLKVNSYSGDFSSGEFDLTIDIKNPFVKGKNSYSLYVGGSYINYEIESIFPILPNEKEK